MRVALKSGVGYRAPKAESYTVFAIYISESPTFFIDAEWFSAPSPITANDCLVIDPRVSRHWVYSGEFSKSSTSNGRVPILSFPEWAFNVAFFEDLIEGRGKARAEWEAAHARLELEFASENDPPADKVAEGYWLCSKCAAVLEFEGADELTKCADCGRLQSRRYRSA